MLNHPNISAIVDLIGTMPREELLWLHGYLSAALDPPAPPRPDDATAATDKVTRFTLAYGTETGNSKSLATTLAKSAKERGFHVKLASLYQYRLKDLPKESYFFLVISTQGDGEPPAAAAAFFDYIRAEDLDLTGLRFAVLGLGDSSYPLFCQTGTDADRLLEQRGGRRVLPLVKCDRVYDREGGQWLADIVARLQGAGPAPAPASVTASRKEGYRGEVISGISPGGSISPLHALLSENATPMPAEQAGKDRTYGSYRTYRTYSISSRNAPRRITPALPNRKTHVFRYLL